MFSKVDGTQTAVFVGAKPLFATGGVGGFKMIEMRYGGVVAVGSVDEENTRFAVVVGLPDKTVKKRAGFYCFESFNGYSLFPGVFNGAGEFFYTMGRARRGRPGPSPRRF